MLSIDRIYKSYAGYAALRGISLHVPCGTIMALLGPSGCGKTTLLRVVAGLEEAERGTIAFADLRVDTLPPHRRGFGMMFQDYALFPHLDVAANVAFGLRMQKLARSEIVTRVNAMLSLVGLSGYERRRVFELSGGERQRVALARTLAPQPRLLMLDEPLAALDRNLRERLQEELRSILRQVGVTAIYVTHDQEEAFVLADRIALLNAGQLAQVGPVESLYRQPASLWVAHFLGFHNHIPGHYCGEGRVSTLIGHMSGTVMQPIPSGSPITTVIAPDAAEQIPSTGSANLIRAPISAIQFRGRHYRVQVQATTTLSLDLDLTTPPGSIGDIVPLHLNPSRILIYPAEVMGDE